MSPRRPGGSLQRRLFLGALVFVTLALVVAGLAIGLVLYRFARGQIDARLDGELFAMSADLKPGRSGPTLSAAHDGPPFDRARSGWYWQIRAGDGVLRSPSLGAADLALPQVPEPEDGRPVPADGTGPRGEGLILRVLRLPGSHDGPDIVLAAAAPAAALHGPLREAGKTLALALGLLGICLIAGITLQVRLGLRPLRTLRDDLAAVRAGARERVPAEQPQEIRPVVTELNLLLDQNAANLERARAHVANLAHGLKTPLATLAMAAERGAEPGLARWSPRWTVRCAITCAGRGPPRSADRPERGPIFPRTRATSPQPCPGCTPSAASPSRPRWSRARAWPATRRTSTRCSAT